MNLFDKSTLAKEPRTKDAQKMAYLYAGLLIIFAVSQLFNFDEFLTLLESFWLPGGVVVSHLLGVIIVISEVFALPFLFGMRLSPNIRIVSMIFGWLTALIWLKLAFWLNLTINAVSNMGFFGTTVRLAPGWWAVLFSLSLCILAAWSGWGLWPGKRK
jgi:hypothetical protein